MRALADSQQKFVDDFVAAWNKVIELDRFDVASYIAFRSAKVAPAMLKRLRKKTRSRTSRGL